MGFVAKIAYEQFNGPSLVTESLIAATVFINVHLYGAIAGAVYFLMIQPWQKMFVTAKRAPKITDNRQ